MKHLYFKAILLCLCLLDSINAFPDAVEIDGIYYNLISKMKTAEVTSNPNGTNKYKGVINIPDIVTYESVVYSVTGIGESAFYNCNGLTSVTIPNSVTTIKDGAFVSCENLISIIIPNSVTSIGSHAFSACKALVSLTIPNSVTNIDKYAFSGCSSLTSVIIPEGVTNIDQYVFQGCSSLTSVTIPNSVTDIGFAAFMDCNSLTSVTIPNSVVSIGRGAFCRCSALTSIIIPNSVTSIGGGAFGYCSALTSIIIPNSVTSIDSTVFSFCSSLTSIIIPNSVTSIGLLAFQACNNMTSVTIGNSVLAIDKEAFRGCPELTDFFCYTKNVPTTDSNAFKDSYIEYATLHVPESSIDLYRTTLPWSNFGTIVTLSGEGPGIDPEVKKCATPTISYTNGTLKFGCETEGAEFVSEITDQDIKKHYEASISLTATYHISVFAIKAEYENSDTIQATLCWIEQQPRTEGITDEDAVTEVPAVPVLIQTHGNSITVQGAKEGTEILLYSVNGMQLDSVIASKEAAFLNASRLSGSVAIVKIGDKAVKVLIK